MDTWREVELAVALALRYAGEHNEPKVASRLRLFPFPLFASPSSLGCCVIRENVERAGLEVFATGSRGRAGFPGRGANGRLAHPETLLELPCTVCSPSLS